MGASGIPIFCAIGNHDKDKLDFTGGTFENIMGPLYFSFNVGDVHFVVLDDPALLQIDGLGLQQGIHRRRGQLAARGPEIRASRQTDHRLLSRADLQQLRRRERRAIFDQLQPYAEPTAMAGHTHTTRHWVNSYGMREYVLSTACGFFWRTNHSNDGIPNGYYVFEFDGTKTVNAYFKGTNRDRSFQMRLYRGQRHLRRTVRALHL